MPALEAESLVRSAVDTLPFSVAIIDDEGTIVYTNRAWRSFGERNDIDGEADTIGHNYLEAAASGESASAKRAADGLAEILDGDRDRLEFDYPCHSPDEKRWFRMRAAPFEADGEQFVAVAHSDVTERRQYRRQLRKSNEALEQFAYAASHDLQEPLRMVRSYLELLDSRYADDLDEDAQEFVAFALDGAERMRDMIDGLLEYSRIETRGDSFEPVDLDAVLAAVRDDLALRIEETAAELTSDPLPTVRGDGDQLREVVQNLVDNAIEYSGDEPPRIHVTADRADAVDAPVPDEAARSEPLRAVDAHDWIVSVADRGVGIDPDDRDRIFEVFQRLEATGEGDGTGLGLAICERIVERHDGELWVESNAESGSTFRFTLPAAES